MVHTKYIEKAIQWAERKGFNNIKAKYDGYDDPASFTKVKGEKEFTPDITGKKMNNKFYIEVATKSENIKRQVSKWSLLSKMAELKGGKLILITPKGHKAFAERIVKKYNLFNTKLVYLPNA